MATILPSIGAKLSACVSAVLVYAHDKLFSYMATQGMVLGANTLTNLIPTLYASLGAVSREFVGFIPAVSRDAQVARAAKGQTITSFITPQASAADVTPGVTPPNDGDQVLSSMDLSITKSRYVPIKWNGEEQLALANGNGVGYQPILQQQISQAFRTLTNEMEQDIAAMAYKAASRASGTAGTAPFGTGGDLSDFALPAQILDENGAPPDRRMVINSAAMANIRGKQNVLFRVNEAGTDTLLRDGIVTRVEGFGIGYSGGIRPVVKGTGTGYLANSAALVAGTTSIPIDTGTGTVLAGDVVTFAGDTNKYVVKTGVAAAGTIVINAPGLKQTVADNAAMTIGNSFTPNVAFSQDGLLLATRLPAVPVGPDGVARDMATDRITVTDPFSGLAFEVSEYVMYRQVKIEIAIVWGVAAPNPEHVALLLG